MAHPARHRGLSCHRGTTLASGPGSRSCATPPASQPLPSFVTLAAVHLRPSPARAQSAETLQAERAQLRAQLDKVNAEIDAAQAGEPRRARRLPPARPARRRRIAGAAADGHRGAPRHPGRRRREESGRRRPPRRRTGPRISTRRPTSSPISRGASGRRPTRSARRAADAKSRQELRRRAAELDRDPFAPMEGSKRRIASSAGGRRDAGERAAGTTPGRRRPTRRPRAGPTESSLTRRRRRAAHRTSAPRTTGAPLSIQLRDLLDTATLRTSAASRRRARPAITAGARTRGGRAARPGRLAGRAVPRDARQGASEVTRTEERRGYTATECGGRRARER